MTLQPTQSDLAATLVGRVTRVIDRTDDTGFTVALFRVKDSEQHLRIRATLTEADLGADELTLQGSWRDGERGRAFLVDQVWRGTSALLGDPPPDAVLAYAAEAFKGLRFGPAAARKLVDAFGANAWASLTRDPHALAEHVGGLERAIEIQDRILNEGIARATALAHLMGLGLSLAYSKRVLDGLGNDALSKLDADPYAMIGVDGIRFATADRIATTRFSVETTDLRRLRALAVATLTDAARDGHTSLPFSKVREGIDALGDLKQHGISSESVLLDAVQAGLLAEDLGDIYLPRMLRAEQRAADGLARLIMREPRDVPREFHTDPALDQYTSEQRIAITNGLSCPVVLISGRPGTGKTTVAREIVRLAQKMNLRVTLAATTGNAAMKLTESVTGQRANDNPEQVDIFFGNGPQVAPAVTLHSLVGNSGPGRALPPGIVLIDEASMLDLPLMARTLANVGPKTSLVFLGDPNQLPPVIAGNSSRDLQDSQVVPTIELTKVHRTSKDSLIAINAERTLRGLPLIFHGQPLGAKTMDEANAYFSGAPMKADEVRRNAFFVDAGTPEHGARQVVRAVKRLVQRGFDPIRDVQVYTPMHGRHMGTKNLCTLLQEELNPKGALLGRTDVRDLPLRVGDPVIQTKNDQDGRGIVNGMRGIIVAATAKGGAIVDFSGRQVEITASQIGELSLAYATTIHKGQGQEQPVTIVALHHSEHMVMIDRALLYVAQTRAQEMFIAVATRQALWMATRPGQGGHRHTRLADRTALRLGELRRAERDQVTTPDAPDPSLPDEEVSASQLFADGPVSSREAPGSRRVH